MLHLRTGKTELCFCTLITRPMKHFCLFPVRYCSNFVPHTSARPTAEDIPIRSYTCHIPHQGISSNARIGQAVQQLGNVLESPGFESRQRHEVFSSPKPSTLVPGPTQPRIPWVSGPLSQRVKRPEHETDNSCSSNGQFKNTWSYTSSSPHFTFT